MERILHQLVGRLSQYLQGFIHPRWCRISSINSIFLQNLNHLFPNINDTIPTNNATENPRQVSLEIVLSNVTFSDLSGDFWCQQYHPNSLPSAFCNKLPCHLQWSCSGSQHAHRRGHQDNSSTGGTATVCAIVGHRHLRGGHPGWSLGKNPQGVSCRDENLVNTRSLSHTTRKLQRNCL